MAKRALDFVVAAVVLAVLSPLLGVLALLVKLESRGPVFFRQPRVGKGGETFMIYKFRTMAANHEVVDDSTPVPDVEDFEKYVFDPLYGGKRYTRIGGFLRSTSLDELPNLFNVLQGDMSLVGPRPEVRELVDQYRPEYRRRLEVKPGITGLAQVNGRGDLIYHEMMLYDLEYVENHSFLGDLMILLRTVPTVLSRKGAR